MGVFVAALYQRRWFTWGGLAAIVVSVLLPVYSTARLVVACLGLGLMLVQIPLAIRAEHRRRRAPPDPN